MKKQYNKFFIIGTACSSLNICWSNIGGLQGVMVGAGVTVGIVLIDNYLLNRKLSETTIDVTKIFKKPKF